MDYVGELARRAGNGEADAILFFIALYLLAVCTYSLIMQVRMRSWPGVQGQLLHMGTKKIGGGTRVTSDQDYRNKVLYEYEVGGARYQGRRLSPWIIQTNHNLRSLLKRQIGKVAVSEDGGVTVYYNPRKPKQSVLIKPIRFGILFTAALAFLPILLFLVSDLYPH